MDYCSPLGVSEIGAFDPDMGHFKAFFCPRERTIQVSKHNVNTQGGGGRGTMKL